MSYPTLNFALGETIDMLRDHYKIGVMEADIDSAVDAEKIAERGTKAIQMVIAERKRLAEAIKQVPGFTVYPSETNFLLIHHEAAPALNEAFERQGIGVRSFGAAPRLTNCLRISMGLREENDRWYAEMKAFVEERV